MLRKLEGGITMTVANIGTRQVPTVDVSTLFFGLTENKEGSS